MGKRAKQAFLKWHLPINTWKDVQHHKQTQKCKLKSQWDSISYSLAQKQSNRNTNYYSDWKNQNPHTLLVRMCNTCKDALKNILEVPQKVKYRIIIWSSNSTPKYIYTNNKNMYTQKLVHE